MKFQVDESLEPIRLMSCKSCTRLSNPVGIQNLLGGNLTNEFLISELTVIDRGRRRLPFSIKDVTFDACKLVAYLN